MNSLYCHCPLLLCYSAFYWFCISETRINAFSWLCVHPVFVNMHTIIVQSHTVLFTLKKKLCFFQKVDGLQLCFALMVIHLFFFSAFMKLMYKQTHTHSNLPCRVTEKTKWATNMHTAHYTCAYTANIYRDKLLQGLWPSWRCHVQPYIGSL